MAPISWRLLLKWNYILTFSTAMLLTDRHDLSYVTTVRELSFEAFRAVMFQVEFFWAATPCSVVEGYQRFTGPCCLPLKRWYPTTVLYTASQPRRPRNFYRCLDTKGTEFVFRNSLRWTTSVCLLHQLTKSILMTLTDRFSWNCMKNFPLEAEPSWYI